MSKTRALAVLERWGFPYVLRTFEAEEFTAAEAAEALGLAPGMIFKTLVARGERRGLALAVLPGDQLLSLRKLAAAMDDKAATLVPLAELTRLTGYVKGGVAPMGTRKPMPVYLDRHALAHVTISVSAGQRGIQMLLAPAHLMQAAAAVVADLCDET